MSDHGLTLKKRWQFDLIFRTGLRVQGELVRLLFLRETELRVGYVVGKRQGKSHVRNRGRRVLREAFRRLSPWVDPRVYIVASLKDRALEASAVEVYYDMARVLKKQGLLTDDWQGPDWARPL